jgi:serine/threonine protein kinase
VGSGDGTIDLDSRPGAFDEPPPERVGRFRVIGVLGRGGMATVYRAVDPTRGEQVALKLLRGGATDARRLVRFQQEAELALTLDHASFIRAFERGEDDGRRFYTMEVVDGPTLADLLDRDGPFEPARAAGVVAALGRALEHLHARGIVHRDLKPANVVLHATRGPVVLDLGLAKDLRARRRLTAAGEILGTVSFMAPEQVQGREVDRRTDVFALGAVLFALISGRSPHPGPPVVALRRLLHSDAPSLASLAPSVSPALDLVVRAALSRDPARRPASAEALARALEQAQPDAAA